MQNSKKIEFLLLFLGFLIIISNISIQNSPIIDNTLEKNSENREIDNVFQLHQSSYWNNFTFIHITNDNWSVAAGYEWCSGSGSWGDPYIIENITVNATNSLTNYGIYIQNSKEKYFTIRNCTVFGAIDAGICVQNSFDGTIIGCNITKNDYGIKIINNCFNNSILYNSISNSTLFGIYSQMNCSFTSIFHNNITINGEGLFLDIVCYNSTIWGNYIFNNTSGITLKNNCDNNTFYNNRVLNNTIVGVNITTSDCDANLFYLNNFTDNGENAQDNGTCNFWNNDTIGNYWSNYTGKDLNDDGIGDTPYNWKGVVDNYPIWDDGDNTPPKITIFIPQTNRI